MTQLPPPQVPTGGTAPAATSRKRPPAVWVMLGLAVVLFVLGLVGGSFQGKLGDVQKNDNSSFLPGSADSTKVANESEKFSSIQSIPAFVVFSRSSGLTSQDLKAIDSDRAVFAKIKGIAADEIGTPQFSENGTPVQSGRCGAGSGCDVASLSVPLVAKKNGVSAKGPDLVTAEKAVIKAARAHAPDGLVVHSAGAGGLLVAFIDAFDGLDGSLLLAAGLVVIIILLFVYRSPVLWFFPLFSAVLALGAASILIYVLAKHDVITLNGQSQGILSVLVIGAGTDYALLLISRYREELHEHDRPLDAMVVAWKGAAPPILASAVTVILGLICLTFAELNSTAGLGPVCAIGIAATVSLMLTVLPALLLFFGYFGNWLNPVGWVRLVRNFDGNRKQNGRWIFWPKRPSLDHQMDMDVTHGVWSRIAGTVERNHRRSWIGAAVVLIACISLISMLKTDGLPTEKGFTTKPEAVVGQDVYNKAFPQSVGAGAPAQILVSDTKVDDVIAAAKNVKGVEPGSVCVAIDYGKLAKLAASGKMPPGRSSGCPPKSLQIQPQNGEIIVNATLTSNFDSSSAFQTIRDLRSAVGQVRGADALVGGQSAASLDVQDASRHDRNLIIPLVLLVILIVLGIVLRALIAPIILIVTVVLSFAASLGISALFFNHVFHFANADPSFPLFAFVFLVALGIDYNIFLMTRVREETIKHGTHKGIVRGLTVTGGVITSAGVVLAATFVVLGVLPIVFLAELGFTVAFGVLLDTILVRSILVPAFGLEIGKKIWWPSKLASAAD